MKRCETCKHWEKNKGKYLPQFGTCHGIAMRYELTEWDKESGTIVLTEEAKHMKAFVTDGSDYYAALLPAKDFGCVMHEEGKYES
jgi:hypothetical protein